MLYLAADRLSQAAANGLAAWVRDGGTLISMAGGGFRDEYNEPNSTLLPVFGLKGQTLEKVTTFIRPRIELPRLRPLDTISTKVQRRGDPVPGAGVSAAAGPVADDGDPGAVRGRLAGGDVESVRAGAGDPVGDAAWGRRTCRRASRVRCRRRTGGRSRTRRSRGSGPICGGLLVGPALPFARRGAECSEPLVETGLLETERAILVPLASPAGRPEDGGPDDSRGRGRRRGSGRCGRGRCR